MKHVIVTGGLGFIGFHLVKKLLSEGNKVTVLDRSSRPWSAEIGELSKNKNLTIHSIDLAENVFISQAEEIYHLAGVVGSKGIQNDSYDMFTKNMAMLQNLLASYEVANPRLIFVSTVEVCAGLGDLIGEDNPIGWKNPFDPRWSYSIAKFMCEELLNAFSKKHNISSAIVRLGNIYGPGMKKDYVIKSLCRRIIEGGDVIVNDANDTRTFGYIDDAVDGLLSVMASGKDGIFNIAGNDEVSIADLAVKLVDISGRKNEVTLQMSNSEKPESRKVMNGKMFLELGWQPKVSLDEGLKRTYDFYKEFYENA